MTREILPQRRAAVAFTFAFKGVSFDVQIGFHLDGRPGEVFVTGRKSGSDLQNTLIDAAIAISIAMQHGVPLDQLARSFSREETGTPSSVLGLLVERVIEEAAHEGFLPALPASGLLERSEPPVATGGETTGGS